MNPRPLMPLVRAVLVLSLAASAIALQASCARSAPADLSGESTLFSPDAGELSTMCVATDCPKPWATCPSNAGLCTTDTSRDVKNCGACGAACPRPPKSFNATALCAGGKCEYACAELTADCNTSPTDGCETSTASDPKNCGSCGVTCKEGELCWRGACGCPSGFTQCGDECKRLDSDSDNCGACGSLCRAPASGADPAWICGPGNTPANTAWTCATAACTLQCKPSFGNCNQVLCTDGCEIDLLTDPSNCGACGNKCADGQTCSQGACMCPAGTTRCGDNCVDTLLDARNCGSCGARCPGPGAVRNGKTVGGSPSCDAGKCSYVCYAGFADCDGEVFNGCEVTLASDPRNCGACGTECKVAQGQPCVASRCLTRECDAGVVF